MSCDFLYKIKLFKVKNNFFNDNPKTLESLAFKIFTPSAVIAKESTKNGLN